MAAIPTMGYGIEVKKEGTYTLEEKTTVLPVLYAKRLMGEDQRDVYVCTLMKMLRITTTEIFNGERKEKISMPLDLSSIARLERERNILQSEDVKYIPRHHRLLPPVKPTAPPLLGEVAMLFREMPYGDLMTFCSKTGTDPDRLWSWANG